MRVDGIRLSFMSKHRPRRFSFFVFRDNSRKKTLIEGFNCLRIDIDDENSPIEMFQSVSKADETEGLREMVF